MRKLILFTLLVLPTMSFAGKKYTMDTSVHEWLLDILPVKSGKVNYTLVVKADSSTGEELYNRAKLWAVKNFGSAKDMWQIEDTKRLRLVGKGYSAVCWDYSIMSTQKVDLWQVFDIAFKDGKLKISISDIVCKYISAATAYTSASNVETPIERWSINRKGNYIREDNTKKYFETIDKTIKQTLLSFTTFMQNKNNDAISNDW